jgi:Carbohydrate esterase, sialic acid-specific acetylesterase
MISRKALIGMVLLTMALNLANGAESNGKHLFILSGQSNMNNVKPEVSFTPALEKVLGKGNAIVVKDAQDAQPIRRWYKAWKPATGDQPQGNGDLYARLWGKVKKATEGQQFATVTFVWMQGERDATEKHGEVYAESLKGLVQQLADDLKRNDLNVVVGRLNDHAMNNKSKPHWTMVRDAQLQAVKEMPRAEWVDTDDLNGPLNGIHATADGYKTLGERFAEKALKLILEKK